MGSISWDSDPQSFTWNYEDAFSTQVISYVIEEGTGAMLVRNKNGTYEPMQSKGNVRMPTHNIAWDMKDGRLNCSCRSYCSARYKWVTGNGNLLTLKYTSGSVKASEGHMFLPIANGLTDAKFSYTVEGDSIDLKCDSIGVSTTLSSYDSFAPVVGMVEDYCSSLPIYDLNLLRIQSEEYGKILCSSKVHLRNLTRLEGISRLGVDDSKHVATALAYWFFNGGKCFMCGNDSMRNADDYINDVPVL